MNRKSVLFFIIFGLELAVIIPLSFQFISSRPRVRHISIEARKYGYSPSRIIVNRGDTLVLDLHSRDVTHGFFLDGYPVDYILKEGLSFQKTTRRKSDGTLGTEWNRVSGAKIVAHQAGKFVFRCTRTCGSLHPFMIGELIVRPNTPYYLFVALSIWLTGATFLWARFHPGEPFTGFRRRNLLEMMPALKRFVNFRSFQFLVIMPNFAVFCLLIISSLWGSPVGNRNIAIIFVWILWWFLLKAVFVPLGGRLWCMMCPLPAPAEWLSRKRVTAVRYLKRPFNRLHHRFIGSSRGWACPWNRYVGEMDRNNYCGMCTECIKSCPKDNVGIFIRPFGTDRVLKGYDEMFNVIIMLVVAIAFSIIMLGPWWEIKHTANITETRQITPFLIYLATLWGVALIGFPALFMLIGWGSNRLAGKPVSTKTMTLRIAYILIPIGAFAWIAFSLPPILINYGYLLSVVSDPLGLGWDLLGTADYPIRPFIPEWIPMIQGAVLLAGLYLGVSRCFMAVQDIVPEPSRRLKAILPPSLFAFLIVQLFLRLYLG